MVVALTDVENGVGAALLKSLQSITDVNAQGLHRLNIKSRVIEIGIGITTVTGGGRAENAMDDTSCCMVTHYVHIYSVDLTC